MRRHPQNLFSIALIVVALCLGACGTDKKVTDNAPAGATAPGSDTQAGNIANSPAAQAKGGTGTPAAAPQ